MLRVMAIAGEPTRFHVESNSLQCVKCERLFNRRLNPDLHVGGKCPKCSGQLDVRFHLVDIAANDMAGKCSCEFHQYRVQPELNHIPIAERAQSRHKCAHVDAARAFALDVALKLHERERHARANGQRERDAA